MKLQGLHDKKLYEKLIEIPKEEDISPEKKTINYWRT